MARRSATVPEFVPAKHLAYKDAPEILTMEDLGFKDNAGVSPVAVTQSFQLFSREAIKIMRAEIAQPQVVENHSFSSNIAAAQLRGYARQHAPFTYAAWNHPKTVAIISKLAGVDLTPWGDYEIAHINLSVKSEEQAEAELQALQRKEQDTDEGIDMSTSQEDVPIVGWHTDSYPFVCVLMLSDCTNMVGGETAILTADGDVMRVRGPSEGCAVVLQGRYVTHQALRALGARERITAVTSFRPRSFSAKDDSELRTVRPVSDLNELYYDFAEYRLEMMEQRIRQARKEMLDRRQKGKKFATRSHKAFLAESAAFMHHSHQEIVEEDRVQMGILETVDGPEVVVDDLSILAVEAP